MFHYDIFKAAAVTRGPVFVHVRSRPLDPAPGVPTAVAQEVIADAVVTGATNDGVWVRTLTPPAEGKLVRGDGGLKVGQKLRVKLVSTSVERGFIDFELVRG